MVPPLLERPVLARSPATVELYLPLSSALHPETVHRLNVALAEHGPPNLALVTTDHWSRYQNNLRYGRPGIYLSAPHFSAWAVHEHQFRLLWRISEPLKVVIATRRAEADLFEINDLAGRAICTHHPLNLEYLAANSAFTNTLTTATPVTVPSVFREMHSDSSNCQGFALSDHYFRQLEESRPDVYIRLWQSRVWNNYAFIAHPDIPGDTIYALRELLQVPEFRTAVAPVLLQFAEKASLTVATADDYPPEYRDTLASYWKPRQSQ